MSEEEYLTVEEAAAELGRTLAALYGAIRDGRLLSVEKYGRIVISRAALDGYKQRTAGVGPEGGRPKRPRRKPGRPKKQKVQEDNEGRTMALLSEPALSKIWDTPQEDSAWQRMAKEGEGDGR